MANNFEKLKNFDVYLEKHKLDGNKSYSNNFNRDNNFVNKNENNNSNNSNKI